MDDGLASVHRSGQGYRVEKVALYLLDRRILRGYPARRTSYETPHLVALPNEFPQNVRSNKSGRPREKYLHARTYRQPDKEAATSNQQPYETAFVRLLPFIFTSSEATPKDVPMAAAAASTGLSGGTVRVLLATSMNGTLVKRFSWSATIRPNAPSTTIDAAYEPNTVARFRS